MRLKSAIRMHNISFRMKDGPSKKIITTGRRQSKNALSNGRTVIKNHKKQCFRLPFVASWAINGIENSVSNEC